MDTPATEEVCHEPLRAPVVGWPLEGSSHMDGRDGSCVPGPDLGVGCLGPRLCVLCRRETVKTPILCVTRGHMQIQGHTSKIQDVEAIKGTHRQ